MQIVNKILTGQDIENLNADENSVIILANTVGQSAVLFEKLGEHVKVQIIGGLDGEKKPKYREERIQKRTQYTPMEVSCIIKKFEEYEKSIDPKWSDLEKAAYLYYNFAKNIKYVESDGVKDKSLRAINGEGVCVGYALVFKEAMDRQGIECDIINMKEIHSWNAIKIDREWYPLDLTWDAGKLQCNSKYVLRNFGQDPYFSKRENHEAQEEPVEIPDRCFDPQLIANTLTKVIGGKKFEPVSQKQNLEVAFPNFVIGASKSKNLDGILNAVNYIGKHALVFGKGFHENGYLQVYDKKFYDIIEAIKKNPNLTDKQKRFALRNADAWWNDITARKTGSIHDELKSSIHGALIRVSSFTISKGASFDDDCKKFVQDRLDKIYSECKSYGVRDVSKLSQALIKINKQADKLQKDQMSL